MMQAADLRKGDNSASRGWLYGPRLWAILVQREMRPAVVVILKIRRQRTAQVMLIEDDDVIETFAADRADDALDIGVLPRRSRCGDDLSIGLPKKAMADDFGLSNSAVLPCEPVCAHGF
jgi:hypothetical protein